jgi:hypothetical protein
MELTRQELFDQIERQVLADYGPKPVIQPYNPFSPADVAWMSVRMLRAAYEEFEEIDRIADQIIEHYHGGDSDVENAVVPSQ